jgi:hypothetical protein
MCGCISEKLHHITYMYSSGEGVGVCPWGEEGKVRSGHAYFVVRCVLILLVLFRRLDVGSDRNSSAMFLGSQKG